MSYIELYSDSARGIYIPQHFAESYNPDKWNLESCEADSIEILKAGPDAESYWDAWTDILDNAETVDGWTLHQDGDLWVVNLQGAIDDLNAYCESQLEYETSHPDAGDNYSHLPAESWTDRDTKELMQNLTGPDVMVYDRSQGTWPRWELKWLIDPMGLEPDEIADNALNVFEMESGSIYSPINSIVLTSYPVGEIEAEIPTKFDDVLHLIEDSCEAYIKGRYAYMSTDSVWYAVVNPETLQNAIKEKVESDA